MGGNQRNYRFISRANVAGIVNSYYLIEMLFAIVKIDVEYIMLLNIFSP